MEGEAGLGLLIQAQMSLITVRGIQKLVSKGNVVFFLFCINILFSKISLGGKVPPKVRLYTYMY